MKMKAIIEDNSPVRMLASRRNAMMKQEFFAIGEHWHTKHRPDHFKRIAMSKYGYTPRKPGYVARKMKHTKRNLPLVLSGTSRTLSEQKKIYATANRVHVQMPVRVFNFKLKNSSIDMRREFTTVTKDEVDQISKMTQASLIKQLQNYRGRNRWETT